LSYQLITVADREPQPGNFDEDLASVDPRYVERHRGRREGKLRILLSVGGEVAHRLQRIAAARGQRPTDLARGASPRSGPPSAQAVRTCQRSGAVRRGRHAPAYPQFDNAPCGRLAQF